MDSRTTSDRRSSRSGGESSNGKCRTPMAWNQRNSTFGNGSGIQRGDTFDSRYNGRGPGFSTPNSIHSNATRTSENHHKRSSSSDRYSQHRTSASSRSSRHKRKGGGSGIGQRSPSSSTEDTMETASAANHAPLYPHGMTYPVPPYMAAVPMMAPTGSIRSMHSVPVPPPFSHTWDGEPCPVHHHPPSTPIYGPMPCMVAPPASIISGVAPSVRRARSITEVSNGGFGPPTPRMDRKPFYHGSMKMIIDPRSYMTSAASTNGRLVISENGSHLQQLPVRENKLGNSPLPPKDMLDGGVDSGLSCCSGHFVVFWIILGIITFGILLGIVLKFTIA